jgi:hypothetical protein
MRREARVIRHGKKEVSVAGALWLLWIVFMLRFFVAPLGYGWGYRRWGPPCPRYFQRRRGLRAASTVDSAKFDHQAWGWGGDLLWVVLHRGRLGCRRARVALRSSCAGIIDRRRLQGAK